MPPLKYSLRYQPQNSDVLFHRPANSTDLNIAINISKNSSVMQWNVTIRLQMLHWYEILHLQHKQTIEDTLWAIYLHPLSIHSILSLIRITYFGGFMFCASTWNSTRQCMNVSTPTCQTSRSLQCSSSVEFVGDLVLVRSVMSCQSFGRQSCIAPYAWTHLQRRELLDWIVKNTECGSQICNSGHGSCFSLIGVDKKFLYWHVFKFTLPNWLCSNAKHLEKGV